MSCVSVNVTNLFVLFVLVLSRQASAQQVLTLEQAEDRAIRNNPSVARYIYQEGVAASRIREARSGWMPNVAVVASVTDGPTGAPAFGVSGIAGDPLKKHYGAGLNIVQTLYDFGRTGHLLAARTFLLRAAEQDTSTQAAQIVLATQEAYLLVLQRQQLVSIRQLELDQRRVIVQQAQIFVDAGLKADIELQLAQADLAEAQGALTTAQNEVRAGFAGLNSVMGSTSLTEYQLEKPTETQAAQTDADILMASAVRDRPELKSAALQVQAQEQAIQSARSDLLPRFDGIASLGAVNPSKLVLDNKNYAVGLAITMPLYTGGAVEGRISEERERQAAVLALKHETEEAIKLQVARAFIAVQSRQADLASAVDQVAPARSSQTQAAERYRLQLNTIVEVTAAQAASSRAEIRLIDAQFALAVAKAELEWTTAQILKRIPHSSLPKPAK